MHAPLAPRRARAVLLALATSPALAACGGTFWQSAGRVASEVLRAAVSVDSLALPRTRAERSAFTETSSHADVVGFLDSLQALGLPLRVGVLARSPEGREVPFVVASRPLVTTPAEARRTGRPVVWVQGNIHAGEVEGKEALLALVRDLVAGARANVLDSLVLIAVPIYNADGNEKLGPQARNRGAQNGPAIVGERANGQGLDLNRDYVKAEAPETRGALALLNAWDPEVFVDLHTTNGSYHGYALTYSPALGLADLAGLASNTEIARDSLLPALRRRVQARHGIATFDYGNFSSQFGSEESEQRQAWLTYDHRPRYGTNYAGLRGRIAILSEAYSHDPFETRVKATRAFTQEILSLVAERGASIVSRARASDSLLARWGAPDAPRPALPLRYELTKTPYTGDVIAEEMEPARDGEAREPGVRAGFRRTGRYRTLRIPVHDRFTPTLRRALPDAWAIPAAETEVVQLLRRHGVIVERLTTASRAASVETFAIDSIATAARAFQGHREVRLTGRWRTDRRALPAGTFIVPSGQPLGALALWLLDPESDDGIATWNVMDRALGVGREFPVGRVMEGISAARRVVE